MNRSLRMPRLQLYSTAVTKEEISRCMCKRSCMYQNALSVFGNAPCASTASRCSLYVATIALQTLILRLAKQSKKRNSVCHHERPRNHRCFHQHHFSVLGGHQCYRSTGVLVKCDLNKPSTSTTMSKMCLLLCSCGHQLRPGRA